MVTSGARAPVQEITRRAARPRPPHGGREALDNRGDLVLAGRLQVEAQAPAQECWWELPFSVAGESGRTGTRGTARSPLADLQRARQDRRSLPVLNLPLSGSRASSSISYSPSSNTLRRSLGRSMSLLSISSMSSNRGLLYGSSEVPRGPPCRVPPDARGERRDLC